MIGLDGGGGERKKEGRKDGPHQLDGFGLYDGIFDLKWFFFVVCCCLFVANS